MIEIEVKAKCDPQKVREILDSPIKIVYEEDHYLNHPCRDFSKTDEALRIRITRSKDKEAIEITYKGPKIDLISKSREEITVKIGDIKNFLSIKELFSKLGFKEVGIIKKRREIYEMGGTKIYLDYVEGYISGQKISLGWFVEVEVIAEYSSENVEKVLNILKSLTDSPPIRESYLELLLRGGSYQI